MNALTVRTNEVVAVKAGRGSPLSVTVSVIVVVPVMEDTGAKATEQLG